MQVRATELGKKFQREWVFRNLSLALEVGKPFALLGPNGSGKTTLMLILSGLLAPTKGSIEFKEAKGIIPEEEHYRYQSIVAPYLELIEEFTLVELLDFHFALKPPLTGLDTYSIAEAMHLGQAKHKLIGQFSSGMKQRLKLGLAFYSDTNILFLDEPCSNLDARGIQWYQQEVRKVIAERVVVVCSNQPHEYDFVRHSINIEHYK